MCSIDVYVYLHLQSLHNIYNETPWMFYWVNITWILLYSHLKLLCNKLLQRNQCRVYLIISTIFTFSHETIFCNKCKLCCNIRWLENEFKVSLCKLNLYSHLSYNQKKSIIPWMVSRVGNLFSMEYPGLNIGLFTNRILYGILR